MSKNIY